MLSPVAELGIPALDAALDAWQGRSRTETIFRYRDPDQAPWWAGFSAISFDDENKVWSAVLIPEPDLLGSTSRLRNLSLAGIGIAGLLIAASLLAISMGSIRRQMQDAIAQVERQLGQYQLLEKIGEGGNGAVYRARCLEAAPVSLDRLNARSKEPNRDTPSTQRPGSPPSRDLRSRTLTGAVAEPAVSDSTRFHEAVF